MNIFCAAEGVVWELNFEIPLITWLQSLGGKGTFLYYLMNFISMFGEEMILVGVLGLIYWGIDKKIGEKIGFTMITAALLTPMVKNIVCRTRPFDAHPYNAETSEGVQNLRDVDGYSFPSGHSSGSVSVFTSMPLYFKKRRWLWACGIVIPVLVALSRMYLGAHYFTDVTAGLALGALVVLGVRQLYKIVKNKYFIYFGAIAVEFAGVFYCTTDDFFTAYGLLLGFVAAIIFEEKVVKFQNTRIWWRILLRVAVGGALYLGINTLLKLVVGCFGEKVLVDGAEKYWFEVGHDVFQRAFRAARYALIGFLLLGVYPLLFAPAEKLWKKLGWIKDAEPSADKTLANGFDAQKE